MEKAISELSTKTLEKTFKRLKKDTKQFKSLIVRDTLDFLDFEVNKKNEIDNLIYNVHSGNYIPTKPYLHKTAKGKGINRPTVELDVTDALIYRFCIEQLEDILIEKPRQNPNIHGGIKITQNISSFGDEFYEKWFKDWEEYNLDLRNSLIEDRYVVNSDIASYFETINISVLKELLLSETDNRKYLLDLLFYFIDQTKLRNNYESNNNTGLLQESIDCSRALAYFFLYAHDTRMAEYCSKRGYEYFRYADDMSIIVNSETEGRMALKFFIESLRRLNLVASIQKTSIHSAEKFFEESFYAMNDILDSYQNKIFENLDNPEVLKSMEEFLSDYYEESLEHLNKKNWIKIKKRFLSLFTYLGSDIPTKWLSQDLIDYPLVFSDNKLLKYILQLSDNNAIKRIITCLLDFLRSDENLYGELETNILETLLSIPDTNLDYEIRSSLNVLGESIFWKDHYTPQSEYARGLAVMLIYRFGIEKDIEKLEKHYITATEDDYLVRKYLLFVSLVSNNKSRREKILKKANKDQSRSVSRLVNFIENINDYKTAKMVKDYLNNDQLYIYYDKEKKIEVKKKIYNTRANILQKIIKIYEE